MPDILKVITPYVNKNQSVQQKPGIEPTTAFNIQDPTKVIQTHNQSELLKQNNSYLDNQGTPTLLMSLLKDPAVAVTYLNNIFLLEETFKLLTAKNTTITEEFEQLFASMLLPSTDIANEMQRQEKESTGFKGELFDFLRKLCSENSDKPNLLRAVATELKAINNLMYKDDIIDSVKNNLSFLKNNLSSSKELTDKLDSLINRFNSELDKESLSKLKLDTLNVLKDIENSILFSPKLSKNISIAIYNLSRYNNNEDFFKEASFELRKLIPADQKKIYSLLINEFLKQYKSGELLQKLFSENNSTSKVMDSLIELIKKQTSSSKGNIIDMAKTEKVLHSLLSSPCNFTPLLHFIIPSIHDNMKAFAEIWINTQSDEKDMPGGIEKGIHFMIVIDADGVGRFEVEFFVHNNIIDLDIYCPKGLQDQYSSMTSTLPKLLSDSPYKIGKTKVEPLSHSRSLMEVFKSLPYKRVGVDVTI